MSRIFITGASGTTGLATALALRAANIEVVAGVHSPEKAAPLEAAGAVARRIDYADVAGMTKAMRGAGRLYLVTPVTERTEKFTAAVVEAARAAGVSRIVKLSGVDVDARPRSLLGDWHGGAEKIIEASGLKWTFLRPNAFMQNFLANAQGIRAEGAFANPFGAAAISFVDARDIADVAARILTSDGHDGKRYRLTGPEALTSADVSAHLGVAAGRPVGYTQESLDRTFAMFTGFGMPAVEAKALTDVHRYLASGNAADVSPDVERILGRPARSFAGFARDFGAAFR